jgi:hypothetical protein
MSHVKSASRLREELSAGVTPSGVYGDASGARDFTDQESALLRSTLDAEWRCVWAGPGMTRWTIIERRQGREAK